MGRALSLALVAVLAVGCSNGELSKKDDDQLRNNFTRKLTPEEIARLGGAKPAGAPDKSK